MSGVAAGRLAALPVFSQSSTVEDNPPASVALSSCFSAVAGVRLGRNCWGGRGTNDVYESCRRERGRGLVVARRGGGGGGGYRSSSFSSSGGSRGRRPLNRPLPQEIDPALDIQSLRSLSVRLIDEEKNMVGVVSTSKSIQMAEDAGLDLAQGRRVPNWQVDGNLTISSNRSSILKPETVDVDFDIDINRWLRSSRVVQWYPGHIAKAEKELKQQLKLMDVVIEVRDARIPMATGHPEMDSWIGTKKKILVLNRVDMVSTADKNAWATYFSRQGLTVVLANGQLGMGTMKLARVAKSLASNVNDKRRAKGLLPRAIRAGVVGYPNVGKSSLINRLLKRRICEAAPRPGVTRVLKWVRIGQDLDLLDSPGILPMQFSDQAAATKLAICDDIGERSYDIDGVAAVLIEILKRLPTAGATVLQKRYKIDADDCCGEAYVKALGQRLFKGDVNQAAYRILHDFRKGKFGWIALERSP